MTRARYIFPSRPVAMLAAVLKSDVYTGREKGVRSLKNDMARPGGKKR